MVRCAICERVYCLALLSVQLYVGGTAQFQIMNSSIENILVFMSIKNAKNESDPNKLILKGSITI